MKKGSILHKCYICGKKLTWYIPTGKNVCGYPLFEEKKLVDDYDITFKGYKCKNCKG